MLFAVVVVIAGQLLTPPPPGYIATGPETPSTEAPKVGPATVDFTAKQMLRTWQFYALVFLFICSAQSGLIVIANAKPFLTDAAGKSGFFAENAWILVTFIGVVNALGRVGTGRYSDRLGRLNAYALNGIVSTACLLAAPWVIQEKNVLLLFTIIGVMAWQYGGTLAVMPAITADYYGPKNLGLNYGLVFIGWGAAFLVPLTASAIQKTTGRWDGAFYLSAGLLVTAVLVSRVIRKPGSATPSL
jgi:OFA family oxalate/formate antiporter-like MFS transporter